MCGRALTKNICQKSIFFINLNNLTTFAIKMAKSNKVWLLDGGFYSQFTTYQLGEIKHPLWSSYLLQTNPDVVRQIHLDFLRAGSDIIETNTYQASIKGFEKYLNLTEDESRELINKSVSLAKEARDIYLKESNATKQILIAGSTGPYGTFLHDCSEYSGNYINSVSPDEIRSYHRSKIEILLSAGVDILAIETIPVSAEAEIIVGVLKEFPNAKAWLSFSCKDNEHIPSGEKFVEVAKKCFALNPNQLIGIGINCTSPEYVENLIKDLQSDGEIPVVLYPNSGEQFQEDQWMGKELCKPLVYYLEDWLKYNVKYVGGCCRTYAEDIAELRKKIDELKN